MGIDSPRYGLYYDRDDAAVHSCLFEYFIHKPMRRIIVVWVENQAMNSVNILQAAPPKLRITGHFYFYIAVYHCGFMMHYNQLCHFSSVNWENTQECLHRYANHIFVDASLAMEAKLTQWQLMLSTSRFYFCLQLATTSTRQFNITTKSEYTTCMTYIFRKAAFNSSYWCVS